MPLATPPEICPRRPFPATGARSLLMIRFIPVIFVVVENRR